MSEILINQLFAGAFLQEGTNIGHEVINLFKDDHDNNYLFITPSGRVPEQHNVDKILFVQNIKNRKVMEVIMKAEGLSIPASDFHKTVTYGDTNLEDIFIKNIYHGAQDIAGLIVMVTYKADSVRLPKKGHRLIITTDPEYTDSDPNTHIVYLGPNKDKIVGQGMRTYLSNEIYHDVYEIVKNNIFENDNLWEDENTTQKLFIDGTHKKVEPSFLEIIRKENDELIMSNLLAYYFNYNHSMFVKFTKEVLGIDTFSNAFEIIRESVKNIDLWIRDANNILVIENKIKSGLNGKQDDGKTQLNKYYDYTQKFIKDNNTSNAYYFLFTPDYNDIAIDDPEINAIYKVIYYSDIYEFFRKNAAEFIYDKYFPDFLTGLKNQTMTFSELRFSIMRSRFLEKINQK